MSKKKKEVYCLSLSSPFNLSYLKKGVFLLEKLGFKVHVPSEIFKKGFFEDKKMRYEHFKKALNHKDSDILWAVRGGHGSICLLEDLEKLKKPKRKKLFIGYSDLSLISCFLNQKWKWQTLHAPMVCDLKHLSSSYLNSLKKLILEDEFSAIKNLSLLQNPKSVKNLKGLLVGGNLAMITHQLGMKSSLNTKGKIVFFEDISEPIYKIERMLYHLRNTGFFKGVKAVLLGDFSISKTKQKRIFKNKMKEFFKDFSFPVVSNLPVGHIQNQKALFCMKKYELKIQKNKAILRRSS